MKSFFYLFKDSATELKGSHRALRCITVTSMLMAISIVLRNLTINITQDLRINFAFLGVMIIAMLFGPVVSMMGMAGVDIIGYLLDGFKARDYNIALLVIKLISALIYGILLYKKTTNKQIIVNTVVSRTIVVIVCQLILNSCVLYYCYTNKNFPFMSSSEWTAFGIWFLPRLVKNAVMLPTEVLLSSFILPAALQAYKKVFKGRISV